MKRKVIGIRYIKNDEILKKSSSGGAFYAIAEHVLSKGGVVYGAAFDINNKVFHTRIDSISILPDLQGSKYVQSFMGLTFKNVKRDLIDGRFVFFSGTPCQVAGLIKFLEKDYENLLTVDFACHGVPSPVFFENYLKWIENKNKYKLEKGDYIFRTKKHGWYYRRHMSYTMNIKGKYKYVGTDPYYSSFLKGLDYRECCYSCPFKIENQLSDITVGDFNGVDIEYPRYFDKRGFSYAVLNTEKGNTFIKNIKDNVSQFEVDYNLLIKHNKTLTQSVTRRRSRDTFYSGLNDSGFVNSIADKITLKDKIKPYIPYFIEKIVGLVKTNIICYLPEKVNKEI